MRKDNAVPAELRGRLDALARRIRLHRLVRGAGWVVVGLCLTAAAALLADYLCGQALPTVARGLALALWGAGGLLALARSVSYSLFQPISRPELAAAVESAFPELGERLLTAAELAEEERPSSPSLARLLAEEAEARSRPLDFRQAAGAFPWRSLTAALVAVLALLGPAALFPQAYGSLASRFFLPWASLAGFQAFTFEVTPGDAYVAQGQSVSFTVRLAPRINGAAFPSSAHLVLIAPDGALARHPLQADPKEPSLFTGSLKFTGDTAYRAEAGGSSSPTFHLRVVQPPELALEGTRAVVTPPEYARVTLAADRFPGIGEMTALANSDVALELALTRPAAEAWIELLPEREGAAPQRIGLDPKSLQARMIATEPCRLRLHLVAEQGVASTRALGALAIQPDQPPALTRSTGLLEGKKVRAFTRLPMELQFADDVAVGPADILWRVEDGEEKAERLDLQSATPREAVARHLFQVAGKARPGEALFYRIRIRDTRPEKYGGPNVTYHPPTGAFRLDVVEEGASPREEEVLAQRDELAKQIDEAQAAIKQQMRAADRARAESRGKPTLSEANRQQVERASKLGREAQALLGSVARLARQQPETAKLGDVAEGVSKEEMARAEDELSRAREAGTAAEARDARFRAAEKELHQALNRLDELRGENARIADSRIDQARVEELADKQKQLAEKAAELDTETPEGKKAAEELAREQKKTEEELARLAEKSELLKKAAEAERAERARQASEKAAELAREQRDLAKAAAETESRRQRERLAEAAEKQAALAARARKLEADAGARLGRDTPPAAKEAEAAAEALREGDAPRGTASQDRAAEALDRLASKLEQLAIPDSDGRNAAGQLAKRQADLAKKVREKKLDRAGLGKMATEQKKLAEELEKLRPPPADRAALSRWNTALKSMAAALDALKEGKQEAAARAMEDAADLLRRLSLILPSREERRKDGLAELSRLRREQEELARELEAARKSPRAEALLKEAQRKQEALAEKLSKVDAPGLEARRDRVREKMAEAARDLAAGRPDDARVSQSRALQEAERLAEALQGKSPAEEKARPGDKKLAEEARKLSQEQKALRDEVEKKLLPDKEPPPGKSEIGKLAREQAEIAKEAGKLAEAVKGEQGEKSAARRQADQSKQAAGEASRGLSSGALEKALKQGGESEKGLRELAQMLRDTPRGTKEGDTFEAARKLAQRQAEVNKALSPLAGDLKAQRAAQAERQAELERQADELAQRLEKLGERPSATPGAEEAARDAGKQARDAREAMRQASDAARKGEPAGPSQEKAAQALDRAAQRMAQAAGKGPDGSSGSDAGRALEEAARRLADAGGEMTRGGPREAAPEMRQASSALQQAAEALQRMLQPPGRPGQPPSSLGGAEGGGDPDLRPVDLPKLPFDPKKWGELPGDLKTRVIQDMQAKYGEDYARMIKLYFEQLAEVKKK